MQTRFFLEGENWRFVRNVENRHETVKLISGFNDISRSRECVACVCSVAVWAAPNYDSMLRFVKSNNCTWISSVSIYTTNFTKTTQIIGRICRRPQATYRFQWADIRTLSINQWHFGYISYAIYYLYRATSVKNMGEITFVVFPAPIFIIKNALCADLLYRIPTESGVAIYRPG